MVDDDAILVSGGCGSLGSAVVSSLLRTRSPARVVAFDNDEQGLFALERQLGPDAPVDYVLGDVRDRERLRATLRGVDHVVHTAGLKQVPGCERHPMEAVRTNAEGTDNLVEAAVEAGVDSFLTLTTDKAVSPSSTMGATKMLAERITLAAQDRVGPDGPTFDCVRLGNALGSAGSVVEVFEAQLERGGPLTVTDPDMTRFATTPERVAGFVCDHVGHGDGGTVYVPRMSAFRVGDLADLMIETYVDGDVEIRVVGPRPGERTHEKLIGAAEVPRTTVADDEYHVAAPLTDDGPVDGERIGAAGAVEVADGGRVVDPPPGLSADGYTSAGADRLSDDELLQLIGRDGRA